MSRSRRSRQGDRGQRDQRELVWRRIDLHIHTPASADYQEPDTTYLDILRKAEARGADIIAFTDHNSVRGYANLWREIEDLELLEALERLAPAEQRRLDEYRRILRKIRLLPGFELTATFGFHILAIFPEGTSIRQLEHVLLELNVPEDAVDSGSGEVGATTDVLSAYEQLHDAGALVIPAHVNSTHGVAMQNLPFGGQTRIAFTQSEYIDALEATDLETGSRRSTARFFNGSKPEYPRRMHIIQGSDAHRLNRDPHRESNLGVGDRMTEVQIPELSFAALHELFRSENFNRVRPFRPSHDPYDFVRSARSEGETIVQAFHESLPARRGRISPIVRDVCAFANGNGGSVFVGLSASPKDAVAGVEDAATRVQQIAEDIARYITPSVAGTIDITTTDKKEIIVISVPAGGDKPYAVIPSTFYVRQEGETTVALRDEIVQLARGGVALPPALPELVTPAAAAQVSTTPVPAPTPTPTPTPAGRNGRRSRTRPAKLVPAAPEVPATPAPAPAPAPVVAPVVAGPAVVAAPVVIVEPVDEAAAVEPKPARTRSRRKPKTDADTPIQPTPDPVVSEPAEPPPAAEIHEAPPSHEQIPPCDGVSYPRTGVEVVESEERDGVTYHAMRDLRNLKVVHNVTRDSARRLWRYAITQLETNAAREETITWHGERGFWKAYKQRGGDQRFNLAYRHDGHLHVFYGVTDEGMDEEWRAVVPPRFLLPPVVDAPEPVEVGD